MQFTKYEKYKNSGVEWLGEIPENWELKRVKTIGVVNGRVGWKALKAAEYVDKSDYFFLATPNIKENEIDFVNVNYLTKQRYDESPEIMLEIDDILLTKDGSTLGTINIVKNLPSKGTVNSSIAVLRFNKHYFNKYVFYQIKSSYLQNVIKLKKDGAGVPHLFQKDINNFAIISPTIEIQTAIAKYLDEKTANIDKIIELLQSKKEKYQELKKTIINQAVTKGLDKNAELKDSGVEWTGKIPKHWEIRRIKYFLSTMKGKSLDFYDEHIVGSFPNLSLDYLRNDSPNFVNYSISEDKRLLAFETDYIIVWDGAGVGEIMQAKRGILSSTIAKLVFKKKIVYPLFFYFLKDRLDYFLKRNPSGMGIPHLNPLAFNNYLCPLPPKTEQIEIAEYLDEKTRKIDQIILTIDKNIEALNEFRKTLINDAVTGKIKI
jgi:type I restriction enzyme S subunit